MFLSEVRSGRVYRLEAGKDPEPLTNEASCRYADFEVDRYRERLLAVQEDHTDTGREQVQSIVAIDCRERRRPTRRLVNGADFYSNPRLSPDGRSMSWLEWNHPRMPWDGTELWTAAINGDGELAEKRRVAGGAQESIFQPQWSPDGTLHFVSDRTGFWNLFRHSNGRSEPIHPCECEFGLPQWVFGMSTYGFLADGRIASAFCREGTWKLGLLDGSPGLREIELPYSQIDDVAVRGHRVVFRAAAPDEPPALVLLDLSSGESQILRRSAEIPDSLKDYISVARPSTFRSADGTPVHAFYYAPRNPDYEPPEDERPPFIIRLHGGPTAAVTSALSLTTQFWTTRGFAVADLNYGGSTGYGRSYRERLNGMWGVVDVDDTVATARHFVKNGLADRNRVVVKGGSAGGYSAICCVAFRDEFAAGASYYGIGDLCDLATNTHKFESRYHETLVGAWPEQRARFEQRSPLKAADRIEAPMVFFQGAADRVVPKEQTETMVDALRARGIPVAYYLFESEAHGFRDGTNIRRALEAELSFYCTVLLRKGIRF